MLPTPEAVIEQIRQAVNDAIAQGASEIAAKALESVVSSPSCTSLDWVSYCTQLSKAGDPITALSLIRSLARQNTNDSYLQINCGVLHYNYGDYETAKKYILSAINRGLVGADVLCECLTIAITCCLYVPDSPPEQLTDLTQRWYHAFIARQPTQSPTPARRLNEKLRVAYVNNYFDKFIYHISSLSLISQHRLGEIDVFCYNFSQNAPPILENLPNAITFRTMGHLSDDEIIRIIEGDKIDILIDMNGHDSNNRWSVYAKHPAPIMASWYNVLGPMGGRMFDYIIMDEAVCPPHLHHHFQEDVVFLPCWMTMNPPHQAPEVTPTPALITGNITFGCFNRPAKLNENVFKAWKKIIDSTPGSHLFLQNGGFSDPYTKDRIENLLQEIGIDLDKTTIQGWSDRSDFLGSYSKIDILLDPFPFNGGNTSLEAMWQGVPMVALAGHGWAGRIAAMLLTGANCTEWLTDSEAEYVDLAIKLARDPLELNRIRQNLRERLRTSPIMDSASAARAMESLFRAMADRYRAAIEQHDAKSA